MSVEVDSVEGETSSVVMKSDGDETEDRGARERRSGERRRSRRTEQFRDESPPDVREIEEENVSPENLENSDTPRRSGERAERMSREEMRKMMEAENISPEDMRDPEVRRKLREKMEKRMRGESSGEPKPSEEVAEGPERGRRRGGPADQGLEHYVSAVVKKNLFLPLGSGNEERKSSYALTAVIANTAGELDNKAIIEEKGSGNSFYVSEGDTFADEIEVVEIDEQIVKLDRAGEEEELRLGEGTSGGQRGGGQRGRGSSGGRPSGGGSGGGDKPSSDPRQGGDDRDFDASQIPPSARRMLEERGISIEQLHNNPALRERLRGEFQNRFGGGGNRRRQPRGGRERRQRR